MRVVHLFSRFSLPPDLPPFRPLTRPRFIFCGRMIPPKGIAELVEEFRQLPQYDLFVAGDGELRAQLERRAAGYPNIRFLGWLSKRQLAETLTQCTALILPSLAPEAFPLMTLEAFACGTPAIVRVAGGSAESLREYGAGFSYASSAELRQALQQASSPGMRERLSAGALAAYQQYSPSRYLKDYLGIIHEIARHKNIHLM
ncbi:MAG: glycosyltransferase family 4 protein [Bryobacterales bacterium]|nr:glycosyltransferase family 4 protein [Bryobacterales bacterium]